MRVTSLAICTLLISANAFGQDQPSGQTLAATMDVYVFPEEGQDGAQQSKDEAECYAWATDNTGADPFQLVKQQEAVEQEAQAQAQAAADAGQGAGARGAVRGAAAGAIIGEVTGGDAGESAAIGAAALGVRGRRQARRAAGEAEAQADATIAASQEQTEEEIENFKKAFSVCLEAKDYLVKF